MLYHIADNADFNSIYLIIYVGMSFFVEAIASALYPQKYIIYTVYYILKNGFYA